VLSANGTSNAMLWAVNPANTNPLDAYTASSLGTPPNFQTGTTVGPTSLIEANGQVFATGCSTGQPSSDLVAFGLLATATAAPPAPTNLSATYAGPTSATLAWGNTAQAPNLPTGFNILESTDGVNFTAVATTDGQANGFTLQGLLPETKYVFEVSASDSSGTSAVSNTATIVTLPAVQTGALDFSGPGIEQTTLFAGSTTIASASNGLSLPQATINVASTTGFATKGTITVFTSNGAQTVTYKGVTATSFTGCTGGTGTMSTGGVVDGNISATQVTIAVNSGAGIVNGDVLVIGTEQMQVSGGGGTTSLTVTRGFNGTTAATAITGAVVTASFATPASQTTLNGAITASQTTITVTSGTGIANSDVLVVGTEQMQVTAGGGTTSLTVTRGFNGSKAAAAATGAIVTAYANAFAGETALTLNGGKAQILSSGVLQLTDGGSSEADSAFTTSALDITHFATSFSLSLTGPSGDSSGMTFTIQNDANTAVGFAASHVEEDHHVGQLADAWHLFLVREEGHLLAVRLARGPWQGRSPEQVPPDIDLLAGEGLVAVAGCVLEDVARGLPKLVQREGGPGHQDVGVLARSQGFLGKRDTCQVLQLLVGVADGIATAHLLQAEEVAAHEGPCPSLTLGVGHRPITDPSRIPVPDESGGEHAVGVHPLPALGAQAEIRERLHGLGDLSEARRP
jgi:hypothetical protein